MEIILTLVTLFIVWAVVGSIVVAIKKRLRRGSLLKKYGDAETVKRIMESDIWVGETEDMLRDSLGKPDAVDQKVLKTKKRETWKYERTGRNQYRIRITVENGIVVGWNVRD